MKMESLNQRKQELEKKETQLKESVVKFDKFLKENDAKLSRAVKKAEDERELQKIKQKEIERLQEEIRQLVKLKDKLTKKVQRFSNFNKYLEQVKQQIGLAQLCFEFNEIFFFLRVLSMPMNFKRFAR